jgi:hypothetical protein
LSARNTALIQLRQTHRLTRPTRPIMTTEEWIAREMATMPEDTPERLAEVRRRLLIDDRDQTTRTGTSAD